MDKSTLKDAILSAISEELYSWLAKENMITDGYEYESEFIQVSRNINRILLSKSLGAVSSNRNKKKLHTYFGALEVNKSHVLCHHTSKFGISAKLQEIICLLVHDHVFEESESLLHEFFGLDLSAKQAPVSIAKTVGHGVFKHRRRLFSIRSSHGLRLLLTNFSPKVFPKQYLSTIAGQPTLVFGSKDIKSVRLIYCGN